MPRPRKVDEIRALVQQLGHQIGRELAAAITSSSTQGAPSGARRGRQRGPGKPCKVAGCSRKSQSKGMCQNHYAKARGLKMDLDALSADDMKKLATDLRSLRWQK